MGILDSVLKVFVGDKSKKDISEIQPIIDEIKTFESNLAQLSLDELRAKSNEFRARIKEDQKSIQQQIDELEDQAETEGIMTTFGSGAGSLPAGGWDISGFASAAAGSAVRCPTS